MIDNTVIVDIDMQDEIYVDLGDAKFITAPERQVPQAVPQIDVDNNGLITATSVQEEGSVLAGTTKSNYQLAVEQGKIISPSVEYQVAIEKGTFAIGDIVVSPLKFQEKELNVTDDGEYSVVPDEEYMLSRVDIKVDTSEKRNEAFEQGKKSQYDEFWDSYQANGTRQNYQLGFAGNGWKSITFKPKYPMSVNYAFEMFRGCGEIDVKNCGVNIDFSRSTSFTNFAYQGGVTRFGVIDTTSANTLSYVFYRCEKLIEIQKLILRDDGSQSLGGSQTFESCSALTDIEIEGTIGSNIRFKDCTKLSKASIESIINALSTTTSGLTLTLSQAAVDAITEVEGLAWWGALVDSRKNWTISLV
jgi:hypothetical protein